MPLYGYRCKSCGNIFEVLQKSAASAEPNCPSCNAEGVVRFLPRPARPVVRDSGTDTCCGLQGGCEAPKRCCEKRK